MLKSQQVKLILILIVVTSFAYISSLGGPFFWDDEQFITRNVNIQNFHIDKIFIESTTAGAGIISNYYRPLTSLSFAIDTKIWGLNSFPFHVINLVIHIGAGILLFTLLELLGIGNVPAFFISLFFLIFPTQTEAVSYINSRGDSLYALLLFASLICWIRVLGAEEKNVEIKISRHRQAEEKKYHHLLALARNQALLLVAAAVLYLLSILAKETALFALPLYVVIAWLYVQQQAMSWKQIAGKKMGYFFASLVGISGIYFILRLTVLNFHNTLNFYNISDLYTSHLLIRIFTFCKILFVYLGILFWPYPLHMERNVSYVTTAFSGWVVGAIVLVGGIMWVSVYAYRKTKNPWILFGFLWSSIFLIPVSGIVPINGLLYEHWLYLPMTGFFVMLYGILQFLSHNLKSSRQTRIILQKILIAFGILITSLYVALTIRQNNIWSDPITFYTYTLQFAPWSARLHNNLGMSLSDRGQQQQAIEEYKKALSLGSNYPQIYNNLGNAEMIMGDYADAEKNLIKALQLSPELIVAKINLIKVYILTQQFDKARSLSGNNSVVEESIQQAQKRQ